MAQTISRLVLRLRQILQKHDRLTTLAATLAQFLLFPLMAWVMLWGLTRLPVTFIGSTHLITSFFLPLLTLFVLYRVVSVVVLLMFEEDVYTTLVQRFLLPSLLTYIGIQSVGLFTDLSLLGETELFTVAKTTVTLRSLLIASVGLYLWFAGVSGLAQLLRKLLLNRLHMDESALDGSLILFRYFFTGLGLFFAFSELNLDSTAIAAISGGLAVGVGFGLRDVIVNFLSGITLLFERSLRPGDVIEFNDRLGLVQEISLRATTIKTRDESEIVIPNQLFWTSPLTSYTRRSRMARFSIDVLVGYEHSPDAVTAILLTAVRENSKIATQLTAVVRLRSFEQEGILYRLKFWTDDPFRINVLRDKIYRHLWKSFAAAGIVLEVSTNVKLQSNKTLTESDLSAIAFSNHQSDPLLRSQSALQANITPQQLPPAQSGVSAQVTLVERSFEQIKPHAAEFAASFYRNLFRSNPKLRLLFSKTDMEKQQQKLLAALVLLVENVRAPDRLIPVLQELGAKHKGYGVIEKYYPAVGAALLQTFEQYLKDDWTEDVKQAWTATFEAIAQIMIEGAEEVP